MSQLNRTKQNANPPKTGASIMASTRRGTLSQSRHGRSIYASGMSRGTSGISRKSDMESRKYKPPVHVYDEYGQDVTPSPLLSEDKKMKDTEKETPTDLMSQASIQQTAQTQGTMSSFQGTLPFGFTKSKSQVSSTVHTGDTRSEISEDIADQGNIQTLWTEVKTKPEPEVKLTEDDLERHVDILIEESETIWMLDIPPSILSNETEEAQITKGINQEYSELCKSKVGNDRYVEKSMNTFDNPQISKVVQTEKIGLKDSGINVTGWDMYDSFKELAEKEKQKQENQKEKKEEGFDNSITDEDTTTGDTISSEKKPTTPSAAGPPIIQTEGSVVNASVAETESMLGRQTVDEFTHDITKEDELFKSDAFRQSLFIMERALNLNTYQDFLANYRGLPYVKDLLQVEDATRTVTEVSHPHLDLLWRYICPLTKGRNITTMAWNKENSDIVAVGYGQYEFDKQKPGLVCCWSLKNVEYPERIYNLPAGVTTIDWSRNHPNLLAVGMYDGIIYVFDVRKRTNEPVMDTIHSTGRHLGPVRQLEWVRKESGKSEDFVEVLVSISGDGRVTQWSLRKGFENADLMKLKRISTKLPGGTRGKEKKTDALISRYAYGSAIAFNKQEVNIYLAGTEDGHIHKCSCSYNEQYLESYIGHTGPIYQIQWSPFSSDVFLSCSADWTIKLWTTELQQPVTNFQSAAKSVNSVCWSPRSSVTFACVNDGAVEVWNLAQSTLDPIIVERNITEDVDVTCVVFAHNSESLLVGDSEGQISVYKLNCVPNPPRNQAEALDKVLQSCVASQLKK